MMRFAKRPLGWVLGVLAICLGSAGVALAMTVQPLVLDLSPTGRGRGQVITVRNTFAWPLPVEIRTSDITFDEGGTHDSGKDSGDLVIYPIQALIQPGQAQAFRVQYVGDPDLKRSRHYYATIAQLPVKLPEGQATIQVLYNFRVLISVAPSGVAPALAVTKAEVAVDETGKQVPAITVHNTSAAHGYLSGGRMRIVGRNGAGKEVFRRVLSGPETEQIVGAGLVTAGQTRRILFPLQLPDGTASVDAQFTPDS